MTKEELVELCLRRETPLDFSDGTIDEYIEALVKQDLGGLTKPELIRECEDRGFDVAKSAKKEEVFAALVAVILEQPSIEFEDTEEVEAAKAEPEEAEEDAVAPEEPADETEESASGEAAPEVIDMLLELPPENPGYRDGFIEEPAEPAAAQAKAPKKKAEKKPVSEARAKKRETLAKINAAANMSADEIDALAYGNDSSFSPRTLRSAPRNLSIEGERIRPMRPGEQDDFELVESMNNSAYIVHGEVKTIMPPRTIRTTHPETGKDMLCVNATAVVEYGDRLVYIPSKYFFEDYYNMPQERIREYMQGRLGSDIDFKVVNIDRTDPMNPLYTGSRIAAMKKKRCDFWYSERAKGRSLIQPGSVQQARVVAVSERLVFVEIFGAEIKVDPKEIAYEYVVDARDYYVPGDIVFVRIKSVTLQDKDRAASLGYPVECEVSIKDVYDDPKKDYFDKQMWHSAFKGTVVNIDIGKDNAVNIFVNDGRIDILCHLGDGITKMPERGDTVIGKITGMNEQTGFIWGVINHINPKRQERRSRPESFILRR